MTAVKPPSNSVEVLTILAFPTLTRQNSAIDFVIGLFITLGASLINALGLNITKLDYTRQDLLPASQRKPDYTRLFWWIGLILYVASQLVGSTFALSFLRAGQSISTCPHR